MIAGVLFLLKPAGQLSRDCALGECDAFPLHVRIISIRVNSFALKPKPSLLLSLEVFL